MTTDERLELMLAFLPDDYDTSVGSFFYDLLYPVAEQICLKEEVIDGIPDNVFARTAEGEYLDRRAAEQGLDRNAATYAKGTITIMGDKGSVLLKGSKFATNDILYSTDETVIIPESGTADVAATCTIAGSKGNTTAETINRFPIAYPGINTVTNLKPFSGGYDEETDEELRERYFEKVSRPNASGNKYDYISWAKAVPGVGDVQVIPLWNGAGTVKVVVTDSDNMPCGSELVNAVSAYIEEHRPIGAKVTVVSANKLAVTVSAVVSYDDKDTALAEITAAVREYLSSITDGVIRYSRIGAAVIGCESVSDYDILKVNNQTGNISFPSTSVPVIDKVVFT